MNVLPNNPVCVSVTTSGQTDSQMIQAAIDYAVQNGKREVLIPCLNPATNKRFYEIDCAILLPSDITVYLENCYMKLKDGVCDNIFRNRNMYSGNFGSAGTEQKNISIIGIGHPVLDGFGHNDIFEWSSQRKPNADIAYNNFIVFHNVDGFEVKNIEVRNQRWWALNFIFCSNGHICDITSRTDALFSNQDGIDLRYGCHHITIERISGNSGDDLIALSAIGLTSGKRYQQQAEGKSPAIHDIVIRDVVGTSAHESIVALRCNDVGEMYNISIENIIESNYDNQNLLPYGTILLGQSFFFADKPGDYGTMHDITVRNVHTKSGGACITLGNTLTDSRIENLNVGGCINAVTTINYDHVSFAKLSHRTYGENGIKLSNVTIDGIRIYDELGGTPIDLVQMRDDDFTENFEIKNISGWDKENFVDYCKNGKTKITVDSKEYV